MEEIIAKIHQIIGYISDDARSVKLVMTDIDGDFQQISAELDTSSAADELQSAMKEAHQSADSALVALQRTQNQLEDLLSRF